MIVSSHNPTLHANYSFSVSKNDDANSNEQTDKVVAAGTDKSKEVSDAKGQAAAEKDNTAFNTQNTKNKIESDLSQQELSQLRELRQRDREVRAHEQAHAAVAGSLAKGGPSFDYKRGPDGQLYAVGGEVQIDTSAVAGDPEATAEKAQQVRRAALAPAQPSQQDRAVAAAATAVEAQARVEISKQKTEDAVEKVNEIFSDTAKIKEEGQTEEIKTRANSEVDSKCAECGGQHSSDSHTVAMTLGETFKQTDATGKVETKFSFAI